MTRGQAQAAIERRATVAVLAGAVIGDLPLLWLIREALDGYVIASERLVRERAPEVHLLVSGGHELWLVAHNWPRVLVERDGFGSSVRAHEVPNGALVLHDAVKGDPIQAERLLDAIEAATGKGR